MSTEITTVDGEVIEHKAPVTLFGTDNPAAVVERASTVATSLASVINERHLFSSISGKKHVQVEGWTLLGSMLGVFAEIEWSRPLENGWEARAVVRTLAGNVVGAAEAMCTTEEGRWRRADTYAVRSMAQTRAVSKALRMPLGFIMHLAGYSATPAEEVPEDQPERDSGQSNRGSVSHPSRSGGATPNQSAVTPAPASYRRDELLAAMQDKGLDLEGVERYAAVIGIEKGTRATNEQMDALIDAVKGHGSDEPIESAVGAPAAEESSEPGGPPTPGAPPKPGTDEYKALEATKKAAARAYWANPPEEPTLAEQMKVGAA